MPLHPFPHNAPPLPTTWRQTVTETNTPCQSVLEIQNCVNDLKNDIATFVIETKVMFQQQANLKLTNYPAESLLNLNTNMNQCGSSVFV